VRQVGAFHPGAAEAEWEGNRTSREPHPSRRWVACYNGRMCGRYAIAKPDEISARFGVPTQLELSARYNVAPSQTLPIIDQSGQLTLMRWGLIPSWAKEPSVGNRMINARAETIAQKPAFRKALRTQRCLVPASGFFEWKKTADGKVPHYFHRRDDELFAFAGLYDAWRNPATGDEILSYTILTTTPNQLVAPVHDRMPVMLTRDHEELWLNPDETEPERLLPLLAPYPAGDMEAHPVSRLVNSPATDAPQLIEVAQNSARH